MKTKNTKTGKKELAAIQAIIDAEYLPEGAQPLDRIANKKKMVGKVEELRQKAEKQLKVVENLESVLKDKEHTLFLADRDYHRYGASLEITVDDLTRISTLDTQKWRRVEEIQNDIAVERDKYAIKCDKAREEKTNTIYNMKMKKEELYQKGKTSTIRGVTLTETGYGARGGKKAYFAPVMDELDLFTERLTQQQARAAFHAAAAADTSSGSVGSAAASHASQAKAPASDGSEWDNDEKEGMTHASSLASEASSDDEEDSYRVVSSNKLAQTAVYAPYKFYEFAKTAPSGECIEPMDDLLHRISRVKAEAKRNSKTLTLSGAQLARTIAAEEGGEEDVLMVGTQAASSDAYTRTFHPTKSFSLKDFQDTQIKTKNDIPAHSKDKISQFRPVEKLFKGSYVLTEEVDKALWRVPIADPSGKIIRSLTRDEAKGCKPWNPVEVDRPLLEAAPDACHESFQSVLSRHMDDTVRKVEREYEQLPNRPQSIEQMKARMGAELNDLRIQKDVIDKSISKMHRK